MIELSEVYGRIQLMVSAYDWPIAVIAYGKTTKSGHIKELLTVPDAIPAEYVLERFKEEF